jgi:penicillin-binding protein 2
MRQNSSDQYATFTNHHLERQVIRRRILFAVLIVLCMAAGLGSRYYYLQIRLHQEFVTQSDRNRIQIQPVAPTRGLIYDRTGQLLAYNRPSFRLSVIPEYAENLPERLAQLQTLIDISATDIERFQKALKRARAPFQPVPLKLDLSESQIAKIAVNEHRLPGVEVEAELARYYPYGALLAHTLGYVGRINEREQSSFDEDAKKAYSATFTMGKTGVEKFYERELLGEVGSRFIETNAHGRALRVLKQSAPKPGQHLTLHLDLQLQRVAVEALGQSRGAVALLDVRSGGVLALASTPSFDPNLFVTGISYSDYTRLNKDPDIPLYNRFMQAQYPPGSTLKPMLALGGLQTGVVTPQTAIFDPGFYQLPNTERLYRDWKKGGHGGQVNLKQAVAESCDTYFYDLAVKMGIDRMHPLGAQFGLGQKSGIDLPNERAGLWPSKDWKKHARRLPWFPGDSLNVSIGQGDVLTTPLQLAVMTATLANRGKRFEPKLVKAIGDNPVEPKAVSTYEADARHWQTVNEAMKEVVHGLRGTAKGINKGLVYTIAGKTGTAQVVGIAQNEEYDRNKISERNRDHALFIAFAPVEAPEVAIAVMIENGEHGSSAAAPVARKVFDAWFARDDLRAQVNTLK